MRHSCASLCLAALALAVSGCGGKKEAPVSAEQLIYQIDSVDGATGLQRMQSARASHEVVKGGVKYVLTIDRAPSDSLPAVRSEQGLFADNRVAVRLVRAGGKTVFSRIFTKHAFRDFVGEANLLRFILEGMAFDVEKTESGREVVLAASLGYPQTDLYIPFSIAISPEGRMTISRNEDFGEYLPAPLPGTETDDE